MAQSVVYADLKFAAAPPLTTPACPAVHDEDDSPYENVPLGPVPMEPSPGRWPRRWRVPAGLLAGSLLLLLVATVALGACYWQVTRSLQDTSREYEAERGRLSQEVSAREQSLEQMRLELAWARAELQRAWREGNGSQLELGDARQELAELQQEMQEVLGKLNSSESTASRLRACVNTECCPSGWVLYRSKCLFISAHKKSCWASYEDCRKKDAQLLIQGNWPSWTMPDFMWANGAIYWIGTQFSDTKVDVFQQDSKPVYLAECKLSINSKTESSKWWKQYPWICEKPPELINTSKTLLSLLAKA
ncbi:B-cell differentiation antigen CD72-like [Rissa tridactyla]|uniref:B-cell differentiation antigen CD72-like n=1 Tax=Rissa tridactyla TaxID=75485 RepID=UPI0023BA4565|nr:B-cell differentiation antigen CD72-like [Rissa tridactyla]